MTTIAGLKSHDSILSKLDTFKRKRKARLEVEELNKGSRQAIEMAVSDLTTNDPKQYQLEEGQERSFIEKSSQSVLQTVNEVLHVSESWASQRWTSERIHQKDLVAILRLLVVIARQFKPEMRFQARIFLTVIIARKLNGKLEYRYEREYITEVTEILPGYLFHITLYSFAIDEFHFVNC
ncbi:unnamed protein product [Schistosoma guineensis]|nr:unnamed protein product [Schistosoma guineensis]